MSILCPFSGKQENLFERIAIIKNFSWKQAAF